MANYVAGRLLLAVLTIFAVSLIVTGLMRSLPGDIVDNLAAERFYTDNEKERLRVELGLDRGYFQYYGDWVADAVQGDFGNSLRTGRDVANDMGERIPVTLELAFLGLLMASLLAIPLGTIAAVKRNTWLDYTARSVAVFALAIPAFWLATLVIIFGSKWLGYSPALSYVDFWQDPAKNLSQLWVPALLFGMLLAGVQTRILRTSLLEVLRQDYIRTAQAKGLRGRTILRRHALRNSLLPFITVVGVQFPAILGLTVVFEWVFNLPGMGLFLLDAIANRDLTVVQAVNVWIAAIVVLVNLVVDLSYAYIDPRIRLA